MSHYLSEPRAWREIAERLAGDRDYFLCHALKTLSGFYFDSVRQISPETEERARRRLAAHIRSYLPQWVNGPVYVIADSMTDDEERNARVMAALWMALEAEDERKSSKRAGSLAGGTET